MKFDFDTPVARRGSHSFKWDSAAAPAMLPMWVADMDFQTAPCVIEALQQRVAHGVFGYTKVPDAYFEAVTGWFERRHQLQISAESLLFTTGVVPALSAIIQALCKPGEGVIVQPPAYNCFFSSIRNSQCRQVDNPLCYQDGRYTINFDDLEAKAADPNNTLMLLCNPHNPVGRSWTAEELTRLGDICIKHDVLILSDEIHCDLVQPGFRHIPFASLGERFATHSITCTSPSKAYNLAGLQVANILVEDAQLRQRIDKQLNINEVCEISPFAVEAVIAAYTEGDEWLDQLRDYLAENNRYLRDFLKTQLPQLRAPELEATYLAWLDVRAVTKSCEDLTKRLAQEQQLWLNEGTVYGHAGEGFVRLNLATSRERLKEGLYRLSQAI